MYHDRADIVEQFDAGAKLFVCGSRDVGEGVQECLIKIAKERIKETQGREADDAKAREWFEGLRNERYVILLSYYAEALTENRFATDVFA
jgi:cytochrome P450/NADPH-cytochrome P450 reductase